MTAMVTEADEAAARTARRKRVWGRIGMQLSGLEFAYVWSDKRSAERAVIQLATCRVHNGIHHFAVFAQGQGVAFSRAGQECLISVSILPATAPGEDARSAEQGGEARPS